MNVVKPEVPVFFWWRNDKNVVIGRNQNPFKECDLSKMETDKIDLARRFSGGGAVYQDLGNSCYTFLVPDPLSEKSLNNGVILNVLKNHFGVVGEASGRNDLMTDGKKVIVRSKIFYRGNLEYWIMMRGPVVIEFIFSI